MMNHKEVLDLGFIMLDPLGNEVGPDEVLGQSELDDREYTYTEGSFQVHIPAGVVQGMEPAALIRSLIRAANVPTLEDVLSQLFGSRTKIVMDDDIPDFTPSAPSILPPIKPPGSPPRRFKPAEV